MRVRQRKWKKFNRYVASIMDSQAVKNRNWSNSNLELETAQLNYARTCNIAAILPRRITILFCDSKWWATGSRINVENADESGWPANLIRISKNVRDFPIFFGD